MANADRQIQHLVEETSFIDTHEHLIEESQRLSGDLSQHLPCDDWSYLFTDYVVDDLIVAGMPLAKLRDFLSPTLAGTAKFQLVAPYWDRIRHTGYAQSLRHTFRGLYEEDDLTAESEPRIAAKYYETRQPGFYSAVLRRANIESCHVNSVSRIFMLTEQPNLLKQDISILNFSRCSPADVARIHAETGKEPSTLQGWLDIIDYYFSTFGGRAVAVKCQIAYSRTLNFAPVAEDYAAQVFSKHVGVKSGHPADQEEVNSLQSFLFRYCVDKATQYSLPVKLHTGYLAGHSWMQLGRVRNNGSDVARLVREFPNARFVLMHIGYPYSDEYIALAKHYPNIAIDMCWAWILSPMASVRFLKEFLLAVPTSKIFTFGGDCVAVESVYGHSCVARRGISRVISELVDEGWIGRDDAPALIKRIMRGNALSYFPNV
ncbi:amidohydrolase family protein [Mesorhizobium sp. RIZ17]|uniref:amidohydrolase family protein n=1 Tax=Mesorhizobium sp. RIZ17 TaxID=3132743 RepID=UPI003DA9BC43